MFLHKFQYLTADCGIGTNVSMINFPVAQLFHLCILRWHDADSDLRCLAKIWTVERDGRHWPPPHSLPGFLAQALKVSMLDHLMAPSATLRSRLAISCTLRRRLRYRCSIISWLRRRPCVHDWQFPVPRGACPANLPAGHSPLLSTSAD